MGFIEMFGETEEVKGRPKWQSRWTFILASIGAAIGLGNFWRFPSLTYEWGGAGFFIPYLFALFFIGLPICLMELSMG
jgi:NSS family neurotransmitter:Na+ symporter